MHSIVIPTIGVGKDGLNADLSAKEMIQIALTFAKKNPKNLHQIHFIIYPSNVISYNAFQRQLSESSIDPQTQQEMLQIFTKSIKNKELDADCQLLFKAQCSAAKVPIDILVYHGTTYDVGADAIIDMTLLCSEHTAA